MTFYQFAHLTLPLSDTVRTQGYLDPLHLKASDIFNHDDTATYQVDWDDFRAMFPLEDNSQYRTVILYRKRGIIAIRPTINRLLNTLPETFVFNYRADICRTVGQALQMNRLVPYACGNLMMIPGKANAYNHPSWIRYLKDQFDLSTGPDNTTFVEFEGIGSLKLNLSRRAMANRLKSLRFMAHAVNRYAAEIQVTNPPEPPRSQVAKSFTPSQFREQLDLAQARQIAQKLLGPDYDDEQIKRLVAEIRQNNFRQLDELSDQPDLE